MSTEIKSQVTDFYDKKILKLDSNHTCLTVISLDSAFSNDEHYYPQVVLKECKYIAKKVATYIHNNLSDFLLLQISLMKNKLELGLCFKKYMILSVKQRMHKKPFCIFETMFTMN